MWPWHLGALNPNPRLRSAEYIMYGFFVLNCARQYSSAGGGLGGVVRIAVLALGGLVLSSTMSALRSIAGSEPELEGS